ncbi:MAG: sensor histidine kinase [Treponema sp.]
MADWVPILEHNHFTYEIDVPEAEYHLRIDVNAYTRMLNNLLQNIIIHSGGDHMSVQIVENPQHAQIILTDNGKGIASEDLPHIFERMYQCDRSRAAKGNGLGLAIAQELAAAHNGSITVSSTPGVKTACIISLPNDL